MIAPPDTLPPELVQPLKRDLAAQSRNVVTGVLPKITGVLQTIDFLGDEVHSSELREGGLVCYERSTQYMLTPEQRPSYVATNR